MDRIDKNCWLLNRPIAHRGLHGDGVPENSEAAYRRAIYGNYPIEMDLQLTSDGAVVSFHDDDLKRMTGAKGLIWDKTLGEIKALRLADTDEKIMTFEELLELVGGKVPLMIEIKKQRDKGIIVDKTLDALKNYKGEFAIQSFDPRLVGEVAKKRPEILRGQLIDVARHKEINFFADKLLTGGYLNFISKPDFVNVNVDNLPVAKRVYKKAHLITWTIRNEEDKLKARKYAENYTFEFIHK
ncbi:MAG: glycerophosphodiester phosphodiesterase [Clostridia bacterium]|nr:glycerophosphodiester phosphodiesterase [Clostridia bacterium]